MKPPPFRYVVARELEHALSVLRDAGSEAKLLAGGQSLMPMLNFRLVRPAVLLDINRISDLAGIAVAPDGLRIGALTRHRQLETAPLLGTHLPIVAAAMTHVAHLAIRNRGTIGGSLSHADPAAELPMLAVLLDARIHTRRPDGPGQHAAADFFLGGLTTVLAADEIVTAVELPFVPPETGWGFEEAARRHGDYALAAVGVTLACVDGRARQVRVAMMGVADTPLRVAAAEAVLEGEACCTAALGAAVQAVRDAAQPNTDLHASADFRRHLVGVLAKRAIEAAWTRATARQAA